MLDDLVFSPRYSLMYHFKKKTQFRLSYSTGFRAPQAFDTDLHIAFAGGGISRVLLSDNLKEEKSSSVSASINYDKVAMRYLFGVTLEGFKTVLNNAFYLYPMGEDEFGELFEKRNGSGATVQGLTLEIRALYDGLEFESGYTLQNSKYKS
jgi:outer membrane receptor for ferrienterochelin and colicins